MFVRFFSGEEEDIVAFLSLIMTFACSGLGFFCVLERSIVINLAETTLGSNVSALILFEGPQKSERKNKARACNNIAKRVGKK